MDICSFHSPFFGFTFTFTVNHTFDTFTQPLRWQLILMSFESHTKRRQGNRLSRQGEQLRAITVRVWCAFRAWSRRPEGRLRSAISHVLVNEWRWRDVGARGQLPARSGRPVGSKVLRQSGGHVGGDPVQCQQSTLLRRWSSCLWPGRV